MAYSIPFRYLNEGEQAEAYKKRKAEEKAKADAAEHKRLEDRYGYDDTKITNLYKPSGSKAQRYEAFKTPSPETDISKEKNMGFYRIKPEDEEKHAEDKRRAKEADDIAKKEEDRRRDEFNKAHAAYMDAPYRNQEKKPGVFNFKGRKEWKEEDSRIRVEKNRLDEDWKKKSDSSNRYNSTDPDVQDAVNRHLRRHPHKESFSIFESVEFI